MFNIICLCVFIGVVSGVVQCLQYEGESCVSEGLNGTCVSVRHCISAVREVKVKKQHPQLCSYKDKEPIVCCTDCSHINDTSEVFFSETGDIFFKIGLKARDKCLEYITILNYTCESQSKSTWLLRRRLNYKCYSYTQPDLIVGGGGVFAYRGQYPHMALLGYGDDLDEMKWLCGGSVISNRFILTAAHCAVADKIGPVKLVALGILKRSDPPELWQRYHVKRIIPHPKYKSPIKYHDIALLEVSTIIKFSRTVLPACLKVYNNDLVIKAIATGWGALGRREELADTLQAMTLKRFSPAECTAAYAPYRHLENGIDHNTQVCFGDKDKIVDTCQGDSGGPLQVLSSYSECATEIVGITSFGSPCGTLGTAGVYTLITNYISWIEEIVWP